MDERGGREKRRWKEKEFERSTANSGRKEQPKQQVKNLHGRLAAAWRPQGSSFGKGRSQDIERDVSRIQPAAATDAKSSSEEGRDADPRGDREVSTNTTTAVQTTSSRNQNSDGRLLSR